MKPTRRLAAVTAAAAMLVPVAVCTAPTAQAETVAAAPAVTNASLAAKAAAFVATSTAANASADAGADADAIIALAASGSQQAATLAFEAKAIKGAKAYATSAGTAGKLAIAASVMGDDATNFGGVNLVRTITTAAAKDPSLGGAFGASLAIIGLTRNHVAVPQSVVDALIKGQAASGAFGYVYNGFQTDPDTTAMAIQALSSLPKSTATTASIAKAIAWADKTMLPAGYWNSYSPANTTGLMVSAYRAVGLDRPKATAWLVAQDALTGGKGWAASLNGKTANLLATAQALPAVAGTSCRGVTYHPLATKVLGDSTGDKIADVYAVDAHGTLQFYKGHAGAQLSLVGARGTGWGSMTYLAQIADPAGSGRTDLLVRRADGNLWIYRGSGMGYLSAWKQFGKNWNGMDQITLVGNLGGGSTQYVVARRRSNGELDRYTVTPNGLTGQKTIGQHWMGIKQLVSVGDVTKDGRSDLLALRTDGKLYLYSGKADGTITNGHQVGQGWSGWRAIFSPGDLSGNGTRDLVGVDAKGTMYAYENLNGSWGPKRVIATGQTGRLFA